MKRLLLVAICVMGVGAGVSDDALDTIRHLAIQHNGRVKPLDSFARETLDLITGSPRVGRSDPVQTVLSIAMEPERWQEEPLISVPFVPLRGALGMNLKGTHIAYNTLIAERRLMRMLPAIVKKQQSNEKLTILENEVMDVYNRFVTLSALLEQKLHLVPPPSKENKIWSPVLEPQGYSQDQQILLRQAWTAFMEAWRHGEPQAVEESGRRLSETVRGLNRSAYPAHGRLRLEVGYNRFSPFQVAAALYALAALGLGIGLAKVGLFSRLGVLALGAGFLIHGMGILIRVVLGGRPPVSNFYETMLWLPFVAVTLALIFERIYRARLFGLAAAILAAIFLVLADHLPLDPSISPVVAVLRSNLWLTIHVLTIVASYGALGLATVLAHLYGGIYLARGARHPALAQLSTFLYRGIQVGVVLLASGIMLGGIWANASWGRYWGWDPKETWALITLLWFLAILHSRFAGWLNGVGVAIGTIAGFLLLLMTYYGVSFYLVGLHSYAGGHAKPLPLLLVGYLVAEMAFMATLGWAGFHRRTPIHT